MKLRWAAGFGVFPGGNVLVVIVMALGFACLRGAVFDFGISFGKLVFGAEMATAGFLAVESIMAEDLSKLDEVGNTAGFFEF